MPKVAAMTKSVAPLNEIRVAGKISHVGEPRELPSGDLVQLMRVVVPRPRGRRPVGGRGAGVDTFDVACWSARTRRTAARLSEGDQVVISGSLRRRFYRSGPVTSSRYEIEGETVRRLVS